MHDARLGNTELQPARDGLAIHCDSVGKLTEAFRNSCLVTGPVPTELGLAMTIESPALSSILPVVFTTPVELIVSLSAVLPVAPASSVILPPFALATVPFTVNGLCATRLMLPALLRTESVLSRVMAPVLSISMLPVLPALLCCTLRIFNAPVFLILISVFEPVLLASNTGTAVLRPVPLPMPPLAVASSAPPLSTLPPDWLMAPLGADRVVVAVPELTLAPRAILPLLAVRYKLPAVAIPERL